MVKPRVIETDQGIQGEFNVQTYDSMMRRTRDKGWIETNLILKAGIKQDLMLEVGPGPGYLGLEWLKKTEGTNLKAFYLICNRRNDAVLPDKLPINTRLKSA